MTMGRTSISKRALAVALFAAVAGAAQASPGDGIRLGGSEGRLHPFLDLETRYDSNVSYGADAQAIGDLILHVRPGLELKAPGDLATVEFSGALDWAQYLGMEGDTGDLSKMYANAGLAVLFNRRGAVSVRVDDDYRRQVSTTSLAAAGAGAVVSDSNVLSISVPLKPGGGALVVTGRGQWLLESFQGYLDNDPNSYGDLGYSEVRTGIDAQWRFLPRTSTVFQAGYFQRMPSGAGREDTTGFDVLAGVTGLLTPRIGATAKVGYGSSSYKAQDLAGGADPATAPLVSKTTSSAVADVGLEWLPLENLSFRAGYARTLGVDPTAAVYTSDGVNGGVRVKLAQRVAFRGTARWDRLSFGAIPGAETSFLRLEPAVEGAVGRWLTVSAGYAYSSRDAKWPDTTPFGTSVPTDYSKNEAYLKLALTY